jgi:hypothetical protein
MDYKEWEPIYKEILDDFGFSEEDDRKAARILEETLRNPVSIALIEEKMKGRRVNVYGAGPSLEKIKSFPKGINIAADGATTYLLKNGVTPDIIVTDLDGRIDDLLEANKKGSIVVIHAHGDNIDAIKKYAKKFKNCLATTQARPFGEVHNFGGFTDGDRAVFLASHFKAEKIVVYGMDFRSEVGRYSFSNGGEVKRKKLIWAEKLITYLRQKDNKIG